MPSLQGIPCLTQFALMQFRPRLDKTTLSTRQVSRNQLDGIDPENTDIVLMIRMKVRRVVRGSDLHEHPNDDPEKPADLWHVRILSAGHRNGDDLAGTGPFNGASTRGDGFIALFAESKTFATKDSNDSLQKAISPEFKQGMPSDFG